MSRGAALLPAALAAIAVSAALAASMVEVTRVEILLARQRRPPTDAILAADTCLAGIVADLPPAWDLDALLAGPDAVRGTADDGVLASRAGCTAHTDVPPGPAAPPRARVRLTVLAGCGRRSVEAIVGLAPVPGVGTLLWLGSSPRGASITGTVTLDGASSADPAADAASVGAPEWPDVLDARLASQAGRVVTTPRTQPPIGAASPPIAPLGARVQAAGAAGTEALVSGSPVPTVARVAGDLVVDGNLHGAGVLFVGGMLDIVGALDFTGVWILLA